MLERDEEAHHLATKRGGVRMTCLGCGKSVKVFFDTNKKLCHDCDLRNQLRVKIIERELDAYMDEELKSEYWRDCQQV